MITIQNETIYGIPTLHIVAEPFLREPRPTIFFLHGYTSAKEYNLPLAYLLAEKGFRIILPDAIHHGARESKLTGKERDMLFWDIVLKTIGDVATLKQELDNRSLIHDQKIGVIGTSMGAITMYGALAQYSWISSAVSFMGSAYYKEFAHQQLKMLMESGIHLENSFVEELYLKLKPFDLTQRLEKLENRPLMIWHGKQDEVVPYNFSEKLFEEIQPHYADTPNKLQFFTEEKMAHKVSRKAMTLSVKWFEEHLLDEREQVY
ncbi:esterase [Bacillus solitudinis]|uniref:esterase n=1 Tax=Bacillus solitudinis TaxID=2014074 RepID=UPI000C24A459|nr:esterase [Bacillus solitudinis]